MCIEWKTWLLLCVAFVWLISPVPTVAQGKWQSHTDWELKPGRERSLASGEWFAPISQSTDWLLFSSLGLGAEIDNHKARELKLGIGYRHLYENWILGGYAFAERLDSTDGNSFNQLSFGVEALSDIWDVRINGYLPDPKSKRLHRLDRVDLTSPLLAVRLGQERVLSGLDAELGRRVSIMRDSRIYGGAFYFFDADNFQGISGSRLRFESRFYDLGVIGVGSRLTLGAEITYDSEREFRVAGSLRVRLPFGSMRRQRALGISSLERRMVDPVIRGLDDFTGKGHSDPIRAFIYNAVNGLPSDLGVLDAGSSGHVHDVVSSAREHSLFFVTGTVRNSEVIVLREGQSFRGRLPDEPITVHFFEPEGGLGKLSFTLDGEPGSVHGDDPAKDVFRVPANVTAVNLIEDLTISGGRNGIAAPDEVGAADNQARLVVRNSVVENVAGNAVRIGDLSDLDLDGVTIRATGGNGIFANSENRIRVANSTVARTAMSGLVLGNRNQAILIQTAIDGTGRGCQADSKDDLCGAALVAGRGNTIEANSLDVANAAGRGLHLGARNQVTVTHTGVRNTGSEGIAASGGGNALRLTAVTVNGAGLTSGQEALQLTGHGNELVLTDVGISGTGNDGIRITGSGEEGASANTVIFTDVRVSETGDDGIQIDENNAVSLTDTRVADAAGDGIEIGRGNTVEANRLDVARVAGRGLNLGADNEVKVTDIGVRNTGSEGIAASGGGNALRLTSVNVTDAGLALGQEALQVTGHGNEVVLRDVRISGTGNDGIRITGSNEEGASANTVILTDVRVSETRDDGIQIDDNNEVVMTDTRAHNLGGDGFHFGDGNNIALNGFDIRNAMDGNGMRLGDDNIVVLGSSTALTRNIIAGTGGECEADGEDALCGAGLAAGIGNMIEANRLDVSNATWRGLHLGAGNQVAATDTGVHNTGSEAIAASGGDNSLRLTGVSVTDAGLASGQEGIQITGQGNEIILTNVVLSSIGNDGIRITGSGEQGASANTVILTDVRVSETRDDGIQIDDNNEMLLTDTSVTDVAGDGIEIGDGNGMVLLDGFEIRRTGKAGLSFGDDNNVIVDPGTEIGRNLIEDTGRDCTVGDDSQCGAGITAGSENRIDIEHLDIVNSGWRGMDLRGGNTVKIAHVEILSSGYEGIAASDGRNALRITGVTIADAGLESNQEGVQVTGQGNEIVLTDMVVSGTGNDGIRITGSGEQGASANAVIFTGVRVRNTHDDGIQIDNNNDVTIMDLRTLQTGGDGVHFGNGNRITLNGFDIRDAMDGVGLRLGEANSIVLGSGTDPMLINTIDGIGNACESLGGSVQCGAGLVAATGNRIEAVSLDIANVAWRGMNLGAANELMISASSVRNIGYEGVAASGGENNLQFTGVTIANVGTSSNQEGIQVTGHGNTIRLADSVITGATNDGIRVTGSNLAGPDATNTVIMENVAISDVSNEGDGIHLDSNNELLLKNSIFKRIDGRTILVRHAGNSLTDKGGNKVDILNCSIHRETKGTIEFDSLPDTEGSISGPCEP